MIGYLQEGETNPIKCVSDIFFVGNDFPEIRRLLYQGFWIKVGDGADTKFLHDAMMYDAVISLS